MTRLHIRHLVPFVAGFALLVAACSGPPQTASSSGSGGPSAGDAETERPAADVALADAETFDVSAYPVQPPQRRVDVVHRVPGRLLASRAAEGVTQTVEGFRIQVYSAQDKQASEEFREQVRQWWQRVQAEAPKDVFREDPPIVIEYSQPYYRVRFGAFASRDQANDALTFVQSEYPDAFMARSTVTVTRQ